MFAMKGGLWGVNGFLNNVNKNCSSRLFLIIRVLRLLRTLRIFHVLLVSLVSFVILVSIVLLLYFVLVELLNLEFGKR